MRGSICGVLALVAAASLALPVSGQAPKSRVSTVEMRPSPRTARLPYTAEYKTTTAKTLADGTTVTHENTEVRAMDSQGRLMVSTTPISGPGNQVRVTHVNVADPVARTTSTWTVPGNRVTVTAMPAAAPARAKPAVEDLGTEMVNGIESRGRRTTTMIPADAAGNNALPTRTVELWTAIVPGLNGLLVREVKDDPQTGKTTRELTNLTRSEPDAAVFQPPSGYEIVNMEAGALPSEGAVSAEPASPPPAAEPAPEQ